jgi:hypothetical protein
MRSEVRSKQAHAPNSRGVANNKWRETGCRSSDSSAHAILSPGSDGDAMIGLDAQKELQQNEQLRAYTHAGDHAHRSWRKRGVRTQESRRRTRMIPEPETGASTTARNTDRHRQYEGPCHVEGGERNQRAIIGLLEPCYGWDCLMRWRCRADPANGHAEAASVHRVGCRSAAGGTATPIFSSCSCTMYLCIFSRGW